MASIIRGALDRISSGICENAVRLHRQEHQQLARWAAMIQLQEQIADLKEGIKAKQAYMRVLMPTADWPMIEMPTSPERSLRKAA
jgi:hypothetical protein